VAKQRKTRRRAAPEAAEEGGNGSLAERAYRLVEELIVTLEIAPGAIISESALSLRLGIGRTPIREALQRLAREKLIVILPRRGIMVSEINVGSQLRLLETRREVERLIARSAARRSSESERQRFAEIARGMERAARDNDDRTFMRLDREFNLAVTEAARNEFAAGAMQLMHGLARRFWYIHYKRVADMPLAARLHADVARAIAEGSPDRAAAAADKLLDYIEEFTRTTVESGI
jgi:DNA-binding GntR family transcriptional regulator